MFWEGRGINIQLQIMHYDVTQSRMALGKSWGKDSVLGDGDNISVKS